MGWSSELELGRGNALGMVWNKEQELGRGIALAKEWNIEQELGRDNVLAKGWNIEQELVRDNAVGKGWSSVQVQERGNVLKHQKTQLNKIQELSKIFYWQLVWNVEPGSEQNNKWASGLNVCQELGQGTGHIQEQGQNGREEQALGDEGTGQGSSS